MANTTMTESDVAENSAPSNNNNKQHSQAATTTTAIEPLVIGLPRMAASMGEIKAAIDDFNQFKKTVIMSDPKNYQQIKRKNFKTNQDEERVYITKAGWRLIAYAFNISLAIVDDIKEASESRPGDNREHYTWRVRVKATLPNGRYVVGDGACSTRERGFAKEDHDIYATAVTRAKNRAISDLVGSGEVSAEEIDDESPVPAPANRPPQMTPEEARVRASQLGAGK